jgi:hypothetical protein
MWMPLGWVSASGAGGAKFDYELISTTVLGANTASVSFNLTGTQQAAYKHLQVRILARSTSAVSEDNFKLNFNSDTASNYVQHVLYGTGSAVSSNWPGGTQTYVQPGSTVGASAASNVFSGHVIDILDAFSTSKNKTLRSFVGFPDSSVYRVQLYSGLWLSTSAISSLSFATNANLATGSRFSLYGVRG